MGKKEVVYVKGLSEALKKAKVPLSPAVKARYTRILFHKPVAAEQDTKYIEVAR